MKRNILLVALVAVSSLLASSVLAQDADPGTVPQGPGAGNGNGVCQFIDEDGDGFNDLAPDHDGDGIPNGLDPDYVRPEDGTGSQFQYQYMHQHQLGFLFDVFGQGFMHMVQEGPEGGHMFGPGDGTGSGNGPTDGTGFGPGTGGNPGDGAGQGDTSHGGNSGGRGGNR